MSLLTIAIRNNVGTTIPVFLCLLSDETRATFEVALTIFKDAMGTSTSKMRTVFLDKSSAERGSLRTCLPHVHQVLCKFHVLQAVRRKLQDEVFHGTKKLYNGKRLATVLYSGFYACLTTDNRADFIARVSCFSLIKQCHVLNSKYNPGVCT